MIKKSETISGGIYAILNTKSDRIYIGQTKNFLKRWKKHKYLLSKNKHRNQFLQNDFNTADDFDRILRLADILAKRLTKIPFPESEFTLGKLILKHYNAAEETMDVFDEDYYENIKSHPFFSSM
jgi:dsDNA-binding SOS-regulon protein